MEGVLAACKTLWTEDKEKQVIQVLKDGKTGKTLQRQDYHFITKFKLISMGGVDKVADKKSGKYMATQQQALYAIKKLMKTFVMEEKRRYIKRYVMGIRTYQ